MFVDQVDIQVTAGAGGNGCMSFRREKFVPHGGPNGGDGGNGGSIRLRATTHQNTLIDFRFHPVFTAARGAHGEGSNRTGRSAADLVLDVPLGTIVYIKDDDGHLTQIADLTEAGQDVVVARGGQGGRGNQHFATATNRAPRRADPGAPGETRQLRLSLKLLADVGLVGFPNVGKSTLIAKLSAARPKIANYPFTTVTPHLGVVRLSDERSFVLADVPGLIEGAHEGHGLGDRFLSHLERTRGLVHVVDVSSGSGRDPNEDFDVICHELASHRVGPNGPDTDCLASKPQIVAANKIDALDDADRLERLRTRLERDGIPVYPVSAVTGEGLRGLCEAMWRMIHDTETAPTRPEPTAE